ncbi:MAG: PAS domain S-box protein, partial [Deltaproteobacteria bacterium]
TTELETSEERYKDLIENSPEMIHSVDSNRFFVGVNKTELDILGYTLDEMKQKRIEDIMHEEFKYQGISHIKKAREKGVSTIEGQFITKDSRRIDVEITATAFYHPITGEFVRTRAFVRDITDRKKLEMQLKEHHEILEQKVQDRTRELKETKDYLENLLETANDVIYTLTPDGVVTYVNKKIEEWGYTKDELIGKSFLTVFSKVHKGERFKKTVQDGIKQTYGVELVSKTGEPKYAILSISPIRGNKGIITEVLGIAKDITDQKMLEKQVADTEKMSAIGQLAAGVAHEVNNPLGGILNCLYNLRKNEFSEEKEEEYYRAMEDGIHRVKKIVSQLLDFSQQHEPEFTYVDVNSLVEDVFFLMNCTFSKNGISFKKKLSPRLPRLLIDKHKISQVLTNILINAVQATKEKGQITVRTTQKEGWCIIDIADSGPGIPEDIFPRIFDPFFTTKDVGEGTGLGLSVSRGIIEMHNGKIDVKSTAGVGAIFTIKLPLASPEHTPA